MIFPHFSHSHVWVKVSAVLGFGLMVDFLFKNIWAAAENSF
jgi:hypothetical protein